MRSKKFLFTFLYTTAASAPVILVLWKAVRLMGYLPLSVLGFSAALAYLVWTVLIFTAEYVIYRNLLILFFPDALPLWQRRDLSKIKTAFSIAFSLCLLIQIIWHFIYKKQDLIPNEFQTMPTGFLLIAGEIVFYKSIYALLFSTDESRVKTVSHALWVILLFVVFPLLPYGADGITFGEAAIFSVIRILAIIF